jgi:hypothetical protein
LEVRPLNQGIDLESLYVGWSALGTLPAIQKKQIRSLHSSAVSVPGPRVNLVLHEIITILSK